MAEIRKKAYDGCNVFIVCFALNSDTSLKNIELSWITEIESGGPNAPRILVGLKSDIKQESVAKKAEELAKERGFLKYVECSAINLENLQEVFFEAVDAAHQIKVVKSDEPIIGDLPDVREPRGEGSFKLNGRKKDDVPEGVVPPPKKKSKCF